MSSPSPQALATSAESKAELLLQELTPNTSPATLAAARELLLEYGHFVAAHPNVATFCFGTLQQEADGLPGSYLNQRGGAIVAGTPQKLPEKWLGFVAWRSLPVPDLAHAWELKRLWIRPESRGSGLGRILVQAVIDRAISAGKSILLLDTSPDAMPAAYRLYRDMGFLECPAYNGLSLNGIVYLRKDL